MVDLPRIPTAIGENLADVSDEGAGSKLVPASRLSRRRFVESIGVGIAALAANACTRTPRGEIVPYVHRPPEVVPGIARFYATTTTRDGYGFGLLARSHEGRPTKLEGHPDHPASLGATGVREQASLFSLYDPDRARGFTNRGLPADWEEFELAFRPGGAAPWMKARGEGLALVLEPSASPLRAALVERLRDRHPQMSITHCSTSGTVQRWAGSKRAFGAAYDVQYRLANADVVVFLDGDLCGNEPMAIPWARDFADRRRATKPGTPPPRVYAVETAMTLAGAAAEHRIAVPASGVGAIAAALFSAVAGSIAHPASATAANAARRFLHSTPHRAFIDALAHDLVRRPGRSAVVVGERQPEQVHVLGHALNALLGAFGSTVDFTTPALPDAGADAYSIDGLLSALDGNDVDTLLVLGPNPAYTLPSDARWAARSGRARERVHLSLYENETSQDATWFLPAAHFLERWGDERAYDGTVSFVQPLIDPLYGGKSVEQVLATILGEAAEARALLERHWTPHLGARATERTFAEALERGVLRDTASPRSTPALGWDAVSAALEGVQTPGSGLELDVALDSRLGDGDAANNPWLQELSEPLTKVVWGNAALFAPRTASRLGFEEEDLVAIERAGKRITLPVLVDPGHAEDAVTVWLGFGRRAGGRVAQGVGADAAALRALGSPWFVRGVTVKKTGDRGSVVRTQTEAGLHDRPIVLRKTLAEWTKEPDFARELNHDVPTILPERLGKGRQWGMAIDLNACVGCGACMMACAVENNIPNVGKENVELSREMYWIRIDRYYRGSPDAPVVDFQPMACQHCERAPCEYVCPVNATVHSPDGLNEMVYNRCVGTRFCSNNCPYKVRRFNFFNYNKDVPETLRMGKNPDVTVRARGVMEKCTYCVQRIRRAEIKERVSGQPLHDGDIVTACEQACPTRAITFGDIDEKGSRVARLHSDVRAYGVLIEVGTLPRTRYLARIDDPNPELGS
jgi:molybdopterin-containing oxidoreductase family iron-sulfur binding subunit